MGNNISLCLSRKKKAKNPAQLNRSLDEDWYTVDNSMNEDTKMDIISETTKNDALKLKNIDKGTTEMVSNSIKNKIEYWKLLQEIFFSFYHW